MKILIAIVVAIVVLGGGYYVFTNEQREEVMEALPKIGDVMEGEDDGVMMENDGDAMMEEEGHGGDAMMEVDGFDSQGILEDVTGGNASGDVKAGFNNGVYTLVATFEGLSNPEGTDFYEGWVVRRGDAMSVVSTGRVDEEEIGYVNLFTSNTNLADHDLYVLTIEPDDGDPAPAKHILEGVLQAN